MSESGVSVRVRVTPRGGRDAVIGYRASDATLLVRVAAPPVDGAANKSCLALLAETFGIRRGQISLLSGETSREKRFRIAGITETAVRQRLNELPVAPDL